MRRFFCIWSSICLIFAVALGYSSGPISLAQTVPPPTRAAYLPLVLHVLPTETPAPTETPIPTETPTPTATSPGDIKPPELITWGFAPASVNTSDADQTIDFSVHLTDNMSGVHHAIAWFAGPGSQLVYAWFGYPKELVSGTKQDGFYKSKMTVPRFSASGEWHLRYLILYDRVNNARFLYDKDLDPLGLPFSFQVTN